MLGNPTDFSNNKQNNGFDRRVELRIPIHETQQRKPVKVGADGMLISDGASGAPNADYEGAEHHQPISSSLNDNFNKMNIVRPP